MNTTLRKLTKRTRVLGFSLSLAVLTSMIGSVYADGYTDVNRLLREGNLSQANTQVDVLLRDKPNDPQVRFLKGVILSEQGKPSDAIDVFTKLTQDFPELPEPYNNLAVLHASQGQYDKARAALMMAIRTNPSYATAHENLGDVYAKLASQAYSKALQLDNGNAVVQPKLALIRELFGNKGGIVPRQPATTVAAAPVETVTSPATVAVAETKPAEVKPVETTTTTVAVAEPVTTTTETTTESVVTTTTSTEVAVAEPVTQVVSADAGDQASVESFVQSWAAAWSSKDVQSYYQHYADSVQTRSWKAKRKARIVNKKRINVSVSDFNINVNGDKATASFNQDYRSDRFQSSVRKTLRLKRVGGNWVIVSERT